MAVKPRVESADVLDEVRFEAEKPLNEAATKAELDAARRKEDAKPVKELDDFEKAIQGLHNKVLDLQLRPAERLDWDNELDRLASLRDAPRTKDDPEPGRRTPRI